MNITIHLVGLANDSGMLIPLEVAVQEKQGAIHTLETGTMAGSLSQELPYIQSILGRLFPELAAFFSQVQLRLRSTLDDVYDCRVVDTTSAQLPLALSICMLFRCICQLPYVDHFLATGALDPLGWINPVEHLAIKREIVKDKLFIEPTTSKHLLQALAEMDCLANRSHDLQ